MRSGSMSSPSSPSQQTPKPLVFINVTHLCASWLCVIRSCCGVRIS